jgi:hypothetical protein
MFHELSRSTDELVSGCESIVNEISKWQFKKLLQSITSNFCRICIKDAHRGAAVTA